MVTWLPDPANGFGASVDAPDPTMRFGGAIVQRGQQQAAGGGHGSLLSAAGLDHPVDGGASQGSSRQIQYSNNFTLIHGEPV